MVDRVQAETRIFGSGDAIYAAGYCGVWLTMEVTSSGLANPVDLHAPFAIADTDAHSQREFVTTGEPYCGCWVLPGECWTVQRSGYHGATGLLPRSGVPGEADFDAEVLHNLSQLARDAPDEAEALRVGWRVRFARWVCRWAVPR